MASAASLTGAALFAFVGTAVYASLLPDGDKAGTKIHNQTRAERKNLWIGLPLLPLRLLALPLLIFPHRTVTHWPPFALLFVIPLAIWTWPVLAWAMLFGYWLHLAEDACTREGIRMWPFKYEHILPYRMTWYVGRNPGNQIEGGFLVLWVVACGFALVALN